MSDIVFIKQLEVGAIIGIHDWEREQKQPLLFDVEMLTDIRAAGQSDDITDAVDYFAVSQRIIELVDASSFQLLEALVETLCDCLLNEFAISWIKLTVHKPQAVPEAASVGLIIERGSR